MTEYFYFGIAEENGKKIGHTFSTSRPLLLKNKKDETLDKDSETVSIYNNSEFLKLSDEFVKSMNTYIHFAPMLVKLSAGPLSKAIRNSLYEYVIENGVHDQEMSDDITKIYKLEFHHLGEIRKQFEFVKTHRYGTGVLPEIMIIGLVSNYDSFLSKLLKQIIITKPEIVFSSEKAIKFSDLIEFSSIESARDHIIDKEIDSVMRDSHMEQFLWMERKFDIKLRADLDAWPRFIELCERRNLFTHTGGIVSKQYINNCLHVNPKFNEVQIGEKLSVSAEYFKNSSDTIYEILTKLIHVMWRKFVPSEREFADDNLIEIGYDLIVYGRYSLAESILKFGFSTIKKHFSESHKRYMIINLANAIKLQDRQKEAESLISSMDWSSVSDKFFICKSAIMNDKNEMYKAMIRMGNSGEITKRDYREWPVFNNHRKDHEFQSTFYNIFGENIFKDELETENDARSSKSAAGDVEKIESITTEQ